MKKIVKILVCILILLFFIMVVNNNYSEIKNDVLYAVIVDKKSVNSIPQKGMYKVETECENATSKWDYDLWKLYIEDIKGDVSCNITFTTINKIYFNSYLTKLSGTTQGNGRIVNENGYRFEGKNPNNYVWFNNELWRIIGVFSDEIHGQTNQMLVKIIRENKLGELAWSVTTADSWDSATLRQLLNEYYFNAINGENSTYCFKDGWKRNCNYVLTGIDDNYRSLVKNVLWRFSTNLSIYDIVSNVYNSEIISQKNSENNNIEGNIGLMYVTDYGYSVLSKDCDRTRRYLGFYNTLNNGYESCYSQNWLYGSNDYTIYKEFTTEGVNKGHTTIRPVLYLNENVYVLDGDGSITDPYIIAMDEA